MTQQHTITREIGIDAGHRVTHHGSKCRNLHGHRYTIQATCTGPLFTSGEQEGMVLDFGFLKEEMMEHIDRPCDHGMVLWIDDPWVPDLMHSTDEQEQEIRRRIESVGFCAIELECERNTGGKFYLVPFVPTAENLAKHWYERLAPRVQARTDGLATLARVQVWETPNCSATYQPE